MRTSFIVPSLTCSALMFAQPARTRGTQDPDQRFEQRLTTRLGLSAPQQNIVHTSRQESRTLSTGLNEQMRTLRTSLHAAMKAGDEGQIDQISQQIATVHQQQTAIHSKMVAKIYASLTPDQKTKVGEHLEMLGGEAGHGPRGRGRKTQ